MYNTVYSLIGIKFHKAFDKKTLQIQQNKDYSQMVQK